MKDVKIRDKNLIQQCQNKNI